MTALNLLTHIKYLLGNSEEFGLVTLFGALNDKLNDPEFCNNFLRLLVNDIILEDAPSTNVLVHVLNALSPIKDKIESWMTFQNLAHMTMVERIGEKEAAVLMRVVG